jgi:DNA end-binding protein Ku
MRSIWKGHIRFSLVTIPVRMYNAIDSSEAIHFNQLHKEDGSPIGYEKKCKLCGKTVTNDEIVKGYQFEKDQYIVVESGDLEKIKLKTTRVVEIEGFVDRSEIQPTLYDAAYFAGPDGDVSVKTYAILRAALEESGKVGLGKVVLRDREEMVAIAPHKDGIIMFKLHYPREVRDIEDVPEIGKQPKVDESALKLAHNLIDTMTTSIDKIEMKDRYSDSLRELFDAKIQGREVVTAVEREQPTIDIMAALKESIEQAKAQRKPMVKATGAKKEAEEEAVGKETAVKSRKRKSG